MYLIWINPPINFTFSDDSLFPKKNLGGGHKFSEFAWLVVLFNCYATADILMKLLQQCFLFFIVVVVIPGQ